MERVNGVPAGERENMGPTQNGKTGNHRLKSAGWDGIWDSSQEGILRMVDILVVNLPSSNSWETAWCIFEARFSKQRAIQDAVKMDSRRVKVGS